MARIRRRRRLARSAAGAQAAAAASSMPSASHSTMRTQRDIPSSMAKMPLSAPCAGFASAAAESPEVGEGAFSRDVDALEGVLCEGAAVADAFEEADEIPVATLD